MAKLSYSEKEAIESLLDMQGGYVSDFTNRQFADFMFSTYKIQIYADKYAVYGTSKANRLRAFWDLEPDLTVGKILKELIQREVRIKEKYRVSDYNLACETVNRLLNIQKTSPLKENVAKTDEELFLEKEFKNLKLSELKIDSQIIQIVENRFVEIKQCIKNNANLAAIILIGSTLEGILLGVATNNIRAFNTAKCSPKDRDLKVLHITKWTFSNLIDVANELQIIGNDVKQFSHALRDFRNYVHPFHQLSCNFNPDKNTVKICWQVLQAAIDDIIKAGSLNDQTKCF